jgi:hypothetical protein
MTQRNIAQYDFALARFNQHQSGELYLLDDNLVIGFGLNVSPQYAFFGLKDKDHIKLLQVPQTDLPSFYLEGSFSQGDLVGNILEHTDRDHNEMFVERARYAIKKLNSQKKYNPSIIHNFIEGATTMLEVGEKPDFKAQLTLENKIEL